MSKDRAIAEALNALYSILNMEHAAKIGTQCNALSDLDVKWHFDKVRKTIQYLEKDK